MEPYKIVEIHCRASKQSFGLIDHYFIVIDNLEYHLGFYRSGRVLPKGTTKGSHVVYERQICKHCYDNIHFDIKFREDCRLFSYYPLLNCETLVTGISLQSLAFFAIPFIGLFLIRGCFMYALIVFLITILYLLALSKYNYSRTRKQACLHIKFETKNERNHI